MKPRAGVVGLLVAVFILGYVATGVYMVAEDEVGVVRRFGRFDPPLREPGLHHGLPWGLDRVDRIKPSEVRRLTVGTRGPADPVLGSPATSPSSLFLTGDQNLVVVQAVVQYVISDPPSYLFQHTQPERLLEEETVACLTELLASRQIDSVLTTGKAALAEAVLERLAQRVEALQLGVTVRAVTLPVVEPPVEVKESFDQVNAARAEAATLVMEANRYAEGARLAAEGQAAALRQQALAEAAEIRSGAKAEAERFNQLLYQYRRRPGLVVSRLFFQTLAEALPTIRRTVVVDPSRSVDLGVLRPITDSGPSKQTATPGESGR